MRKTLKSRILTGLVTLAAAFALAVGGPAPRQAIASNCGENSGNLCKKNESCLWILFFKQCTETYYYYPE